MSTFIVLCTFDREGAEVPGTETVDADMARTLAESVGATLDNFWFTAGTYDLVAVVTAPDNRKALAFLVAFSGLGRASTLTLTAEADVAGVLSDARGARDAHTKHLGDAHTKHESGGHTKH
jgi:uncharacterized protein with GYD domain